MVTGPSFFKNLNVLHRQVQNMVAHNCLSKTKNLTAKTKCLTAKPKTSRQIQILHREVAGGQIGRVQYFLNREIKHLLDCGKINKIEGYVTGALEYRKCHDYQCSKLNCNKNRRKAIFNWAAKGLFFLKGGGGYTHSGYHKTLSATIACAEPHVRLTLLKDFHNQNKRVLFLSGGCIITFEFHHYE